MEFESRLQLIEYLDTLIKRKYRGSSSDYAKKLNVSNATFFRLLKHIREKYQTKIFYDNIDARYHYEHEGTLFFGFLPDWIVSQQKLKRFEPNKKPKDG